MKLPTRLGNNGSTLIEGLIAVGILGLIFSLGLPVAQNFYLDYQFDGEAHLLGSLLRHARSLSMVNHNQSSHGIYVGTSDLVVFQGTSYEGRVAAQDRIYPRNASISIVGPAELTFSALAGQTSSSTFTLSADGKSRYIFVNPEGLVYE